MSLKCILLNCLSVLTLVSADPSSAAGDTKDRSIRASRHRRGRGTQHTINSPNTTDSSIDDSFTIGDEVVQLAEAGGYPRLTRLSDDSILAATTRAEEGTTIVSITRSTDGGSTFTSLGSVAEGESDKSDISNAFLIQLPSGTVLCAFRNHGKNADGEYTHFRITVSGSEDGGKTWQFYSQAVEVAATEESNGIWEPFMRIGKEGEVQLTYSGELAADNQETFLVTSSDGRRWTEPRNLLLHAEDEHFRDGMQGIVPFTASNGSEALMMVFETYKEDHFLIEYVLSYDDGASWGSRGGVYDPPKNSAGSPQIAKLGDDYMAVVFGTDKDTDYEHDGWHKAASIVMVFSECLGQGKISWTTEPMLVSETPSFWPSAFAVDTNNIMAAFEYDGIPQGKIVSRELVQSGQ